MEKRIGTILILQENKEAVSRLNEIISNHADIIIGRIGLPRKQFNQGIISLLLEGTTDQISSLSGQIGKLAGVQVKSVVLKQ